MLTPRRMMELDLGSTKMSDLREAAVDNAPTVPLYIIEEHNEAFIIWNQLRVKRPEDLHNCSLLHVDQHSDLGIPRLRASLDCLYNMEIEDIIRFTYEEISIANFIMAAIYLGIFDHVVWLEQEYPIGGRHLSAETPFMIVSDEVLRVRKKVKGYIRSRNELGVDILVGEYDERIEQIFDSSRRVFTAEYATGNQKIERKPKWIVDIDLDYFSCSGDPFKQIELKLEISPSEYKNLQRPYAAFNLLKGRPRLKCEDGRFYAIFNEVDHTYSSEMTVNELIIGERARALKTFLLENCVNPALITICRSRHSGFVRPDQCAFIEMCVIEMLNSTYKMSPPEHLNQLPNDATRP